MRQSIYYIANNPDVQPVLGQYFQAQGYRWEEYPIKEQPQVDYLVIVEPVRIGKELYTLSSAWKPWLMDRRPQTRLIVAAFAQSHHSNCLNLLNLPENLKEWLKGVRVITDFPMVKSVDEHGTEQYVDPWNFGLISPGYDLQARMKKFVTGHFYYEHSSLSGQIINIKKIFIDLSHTDLSKSDLPAVKKEMLEELENKINYFTHRWKHYSPLFEFVPYQKAIDKIREDIQELTEAIESIRQGKKINAWNKLPLRDTLETIKKEMNRYIFPEEYW